jgi:DNA-binding Lrp family transcriptional regulator
MTQQRSRTPEPPYCWQSKAALRRIREYMEDRDQWSLVSSRLCVYQALCEMASNHGSDSFIASQKALTNLCGISERWVRSALRDLESAGLITACHPKHGGRGQKTYLLLSCAERSELSSERPEPTSERPELDPHRNSVPTLEEIRVEEHREESSSTSAGEGSSSSSATRKKRASSASVAGLSFADRFRATLPDKVSLVAGWREKWARAYDDMVRLDKRDPGEIERVWQWARGDEFWAPQFQSPLKLRKRNREGVTYYDVFLAKLNGDQPHRRRKDPPI